MRIGITPLFVLSLSASALAQTSESQSSSNSTDMSLLYAGVDGFLLQQFPLDDSQLSSKAITAAASNQSLTPVGKSPTTQQPPLPVNKLVFAHFIVGNTYNYTVNSWKADITLASSKGIDAFALNVGSDPWEPSQVANAFSAATALKTSFKLFLSFDMGSLPCDCASHADLLQEYISTYRTHPNQQMINGKVLISTFAGSQCLFEQNTVDEGWTFAIKSGANANGVFFIPAWFIDPATFPQYTVLDGAFAWNSGWPLGDHDIDFQQDQDYLNGLPGRAYMAASSPWFFTHYDTKNFIWRGDDWLLAERWEDLIAHRAQVNFVEVNTWNDYGESHYIGPIEGIQPNSQAWVDGYDHTPWLDLYKFYISAFKAGTYPAITADRTFVWGRTYRRDAVATNDVLSPPDHYTWTDDYIYAVVLLRTPATFTLTCGTLTTSSSLPAGVGKVKLGPLTQSCTVSSAITRGRTVINNSYQSKFKFTTNNPTIYNFNAYVVSS